MVICEIFKAVFNPKDVDKNIEIYTKFLSKIALFTLIFVAILVAIIWLIAKSSVGQDIAILVLCITFALNIGIISIKEMLAETRDGGHA